jgi:small subunit ribosomal protein S8
MITDAISDMIVKIKNAYKARKKEVDIPASYIKREILKIIKEEGFIGGIKDIKDSRQGILRVSLKYNTKKIKAITNIKRISKPGLKIYVDADNIPRVLGGYGVAILSTSKGVMTDSDARKNNIGGEVLLHIW